MKTSEEIIRDEIEEGLEDSETSRVVSIEFSKAFTIDGHHRQTYREVYHVVITHEYSRETELEVIRVLIDDRKQIVGMERVFKS